MRSVLAGKVFIWAFFLFIIDGGLVLAASKYGVPIRPVYVYAGIALGLLGTAVLIGDPRELLDDKAFFGLFLAIAALGAVMYRGETAGPDFGGITLSSFPSKLGYAIWPILNLVSSAALYLLARRDEWRRTIVFAAFAALALQFATMGVDMWWAAAFGDPNGRAGGLAQNANIAALLVAILASLTLSDQRISCFAVMLAVAGILLSQSKTGFVAAAFLVICFALTLRRHHHVLHRSAIAFAVLLVAVLAATAIFSPVLNPSPEQLAKRRETIAELERQQRLPVGPLDVPVSLEERLKLRTSMDVAAGLRWEALNFYTEILKENPRALLTGFGTGFTNKFATGPHNEFLKLAVDNGLLPALLLLALLITTTWKAVVARSPQLIALSLISWMTAALFHTMVVDPMVLPALAIGLATKDSA